jgi:hypothetical protein
LQVVASGSAVADVIGGSRSAEGVFVTYVRYADAGHIALVERWPDNTTRAYGGAIIRADDIEFWPSERGARQLA